MNPLVMPLISTAAGLFGSLFGATSQRKSVQDTNALNAKLQRETNAQNLAIARENNALQERLMRENNAFNRQQAIDMFNLEAAYNDPKKQKERLLNAGINPNVAFAGSSTSAGSVNAATPVAGSSGVSPSMPSLGTARMETPPSVINTMFPHIESFTRSLANLSQSGLNDTERRKLDLTMSAELESIMQDTAYKKAQESWQNLQTKFEQIYGAAGRSADVRKTLNDAYKAYNDALLASVKGDSERSQQLVNKANEELISSQNQQLREQLPFLIANAEESVNLIKEQQKTQKSMQASNYASANASNALAGKTDEETRQLKAMADDIVAIKKADRIQLQKNVELLRDTYNAQKKRLIALGEMSEAQFRQIEAQASQQEKENSAWWFTYCFDKIERTAKGVASFIPFTNPNGNQSPGNIYTPMWSTSTSQ